MTLKDKMRMLNNPPEDSLVAGIMSGTSCDGVDICVSTFPNDDVVASQFFPFPKSLQQTILQVADPDWQGKKIEILLAEKKFTQFVVESFQKFLTDNNLKKAPLAIGFHGHTIEHAPPEATWQMGNSASLCHQLKTIVCSDFRGKDLVEQGQGAPLLPVYHQLKFQAPSTAIQNIGGIGNLTLLKTDSKPLEAFDTGPGNILMNMAMQEFTNNEKDYDEGGNLAGSGIINQELLNSWLEIEKDYLNAAPPKSTGRERYSKTYFKNLLSLAKNESKENIMATLTALTAETIIRSLNQFGIEKGREIKRLVICGGGAKNKTLLHQLQKLAGNGLKVITSDEMGVDSQFIEAQAFAHFAWKSLNQLPHTEISVTGAKSPTTCGAISFP